MRTTDLHNWFHSYLERRINAANSIHSNTRVSNSMNAREKPFANKLRTRIKMSTTSASCIFSMVIRSLIQMRACVLYFKLFYGFNKVMRTTYNIARMVFQPIRLQTREIWIKIAFGLFHFRLKCFSSCGFQHIMISHIPWIFWLEFKLFAAIYSERKNQSDRMNVFMAVIYSHWVF